LYEKSLAAWFAPWVLPDGIRPHFAFLTPEPSAVMHSSLVHMLETVSARFGPGAFHAKVSSNGAWEIDFESAANALRGEALVVAGTAFSFVHFCDWAKEEGLSITLRPSARIFETGGYKGRSREVPKETLHGMIRETFGVSDTQLISEYGMSELSSQAYDRRFGTSGPRHFHFPPWARPVVISPETGTECANGEAGLLRVYDLANVGSVMALQTEDIAVDQGNGFELLGRASRAEARGCSLMHI
jgi:hypothetical protein